VGDDQFQRLDELRRLGLSESAVRLAAGEPPIAGFDACSPPPRFLHGPPVPLGVDRFIPLWQFSGGVTGIWRRNGHLEFVEYLLDRHPGDGYQLLARSEQGLWACMLIGGVRPDETATFAQRVGFRFLDMDGFQNLYRAAQSMPEWDSIVGFRAVIERIDAESQESQPHKAEPDVAAERAATSCLERRASPRPGC
jgi:hypothetical protein